jgi:hypothetical protein
MARVSNNELVGGYTHRAFVTVDDIAKPANFGKSAGVTVTIEGVPAGARVRDVSVRRYESFKNKDVLEDADVVLTATLSSNGVDATEDYIDLGTDGLEGKTAGAPVYFTVSGALTSLPPPLQQSMVYFLKETASSGKYNVYEDVALASKVDITAVGAPGAGITVTEEKGNHSLAITVGDGDSITQFLGSTQILNSTGTSYADQASVVKSSGYWQDGVGYSTAGQLKVGFTTDAYGDFKWLGYGKLMVLANIEDPDSYLPS